MPYHTLITDSSYNMSQGAHVLFVYVNDLTSGLFINIFLAIIAIAVGIGTFMYQQKRTSQGDLPLTFAVSSFITTIVAILLNLIPDADGHLVDTSTYIICFVISLVSLTIYLLSEKEQ